MKANLHAPGGVRVNAAHAAVSGVVTAIGPQVAAVATSTVAAVATSTSTLAGPVIRPPVAAVEETPLLSSSADTGFWWSRFADNGTVETAYFGCVSANGGVNGHPIGDVERDASAQGRVHLRDFRRATAPNRAELLHGVEQDA